MTGDILQRGDVVQITAGDQVVNAMVVLASPNGKSLMVMFEAIIDGHVGQMPLFRDESGGYVAVITGRQITLERVEI
jgi:hypothetical protein